MDGDLFYTLYKVTTELVTIILFGKTCDIKSLLPRQLKG